MLVSTYFLIIVFGIFVFAITQVFLISLQKNPGNNTIIDAIFWSMIAIILMLYLHNQNVNSKLIK